MAYTNGVGSLQNVVGAQPVSGAREAARPDHAGASKANAHTTANSADSAQLSSTSSLVSAALAVPDVRSAKVADLQAAIADGSYYVSATDVAGKIVNSLLG